MRVSRAPTNLVPSMLKMGPQLHENYSHVTAAPFSGQCDGESRRATSRRVTHMLCTLSCCRLRLDAAGRRLHVKGEGNKGSRDIPAHFRETRDTPPSVRSVGDVKSIGPRPRILQRFKSPREERPIQQVVALSSAPATDPRVQPVSSSAFNEPFASG
jgi:hypothetical protein